jgi:hypothetical protein
MNPCDRWRDRLAEHALGLPAEPGLAEHLAKCPTCSATLAKMKSLTAKIDAGIHHLASAEPDADSPTRILEQVSSLAAQKRWWQPTGKLATAALAAMIFLAASLGVLWKVRVQREGAERALSAAAEISSWKSPTQELLRSPYENVLSGIPRLGEGFYQLDAGGLKRKNSAPRVKENKKQ